MYTCRPTLSLHDALPSVPDDGTVVALDGPTDRGFHSRAGIKHLLAVFGLRHHLVFGHQEAATVGRGHEKRPLRLMNEDRHDALVVGPAHHQPPQLAAAAAARPIGKASCRESECQYE